MGTRGTGNSADAGRWKQMGFGEEEEGQTSDTNLATNLPSHLHCPCTAVLSAPLPPRATPCLSGSSNMVSERSVMALNSGRRSLAWGRALEASSLVHRPWATSESGTWQGGLRFESKKSGHSEED